MLVTFVDVTDARKSRARCFGVVGPTRAIAMPKKERQTFASPVTGKDPSTADAEEPQNDDEAQGHAEQPQENQNHGYSPFLITGFSPLSSFPPEQV